MITRDLGLRAARRLCTQADVELVLPGDLRREVVLHAMALAHQVTGDGWDLSTARLRVSVAVPGLGDVGRLAGLLPAPLGGVLTGLAEQTRRPMVMLSPAALMSGEDTLETVQHELGHIGDVRAGGLAWCVAYGIHPTARAAGEAPCYGTSMAIRVRLGGVSIEDAMRDARRSLESYGLDAEARTLAERILVSHEHTLLAGGDPGGVVAEAIAALVAEGWRP